MQRVAIFVDAGYLYAAGSVALYGRNMPRIRVALSRDEAIAKLQATSKDKTSGASLLRIYWYDGVPPHGPSIEQRRLSDMDNVKLRLGVVTPRGQQKGVDSLIVTDLVELARNRAISDAVLLSGDEDVRIGVQIAQSFGVRVHLIGIEPSRGNQSRALMQEADTTTEWNKVYIENLLTLRPDFGAATETEARTRSDSDFQIEETMNEVVAGLIGSLDPDAIRSIANLAPNAMIPWQYDRWLMARASDLTGSSLNQNEKHYLRSRLKAAARDSASAAESGSDSGG